MKTFSGKIIFNVAIISVAMTSIPSFADMYRCAQPNGTVEYRGRPCSEGESQRALDDRDARKRREEEESRKRAIEEKQKDAELQRQYEQAGKEADKKNAKKAAEISENYARRLTACFNMQGKCQDDDYIYGLKCREPDYIERMFGSPTDMQNVGGQKYIYYNVPIYNGTKIRTGKLQLVLEYSSCPGHLWAPGMNWAPELPSALRAMKVNIF